MNIVKLQDDLKSVPDQSLVGYVQNPTGQVPSYLALSELQRRKKMREQVQGNQAQGAQPSVAEQLVSEAQPQAPQGIAGIPVSNVGSEEAYAAGGIIAFDEGGDVPGYAAGDLVTLQKLRDLKRASTRITRGGPLYEAPSLLPRDPMYQLAKQYPDATSLDSAIAQLESKVSLDTSKPKVMASEQPNQAQMMANMEAAKLRNAVAAGEYQQTIAPTPDLYKGIVTDKFKAPAAPRVPAIPAAPASPAAGFDVKPMGYNDSIYDAAMRPEITAEEGAQRFKAALGEDPTRAKLAERAGAMEKENEAFKAQYPWMALAEAGFNMAAGTSPNALSNIAAGGMKGVAALGTGRKEARAAEEKVYDLQAKIADAERAENRAALQHGFESEERVKASNDKNKLMKAEAKARVDVANKEIEVKGAQYSQKEREMLMDDARKGQQIQATYANINSGPNEINAIMADLRKDPKNKGLSEADLRRMAYETKAAGSIYGANQRTAASERAAYVDEIESIGKQYPFGANMPPEVKLRLAQLRSLVSGGASVGAAPAAVSNPYGLKLSKS